jgi:riboflavin kinase/FMN adenylyltransferase
VTQTVSSSAQKDDKPGILVFPGETELDSGGFTEPLHLALGMFDGVHIGHQAVIQQAIEAARDVRDHHSGVLTFNPHPSRVLYPQRATALLMPLGRRVQRMLQLGVDRVFVQAFTPSYARREAAEFVPSLKVIFPGLVSLHVGENFRFGAGRSGDVMTLCESAAPVGVIVHSHGRKDFGGELVSSSRIRKALAEGRLEEANGMMGAPYLVEGKVAPGRGLGRGLGFPTLNIPWNPEAAPRFGVYKVSLQAAGSGEWLTGIANYGVRPTVGKPGDPLLEVHLLETGAVAPSEMEDVQVKLFAFIRPERSFPSVEALRSQIEVDVALVRKVTK